MEIVIALVIGVISIFFLTSKASGKTGKTGLDGIIEKYGKENSVPFSTLKAVIRQESGFNEKAHGDKDIGAGAIGLMQIRQPALDDFNIAHGTSYDLEDLYAADLNVRVGAWYLGRLIKRNGLHAGIESYNVGESGYRNGKRNTKYLSSVVDFSKNFA